MLVCHLLLYLLSFVAYFVAIFACHNLQHFRIFSLESLKYDKNRYLYQTVGNFPANFFPHFFSLQDTVLCQNPGYLFIDVREMAKRKLKAKFKANRDGKSSKGFRIMFSCETPNDKDFVIGKPNAVYD